jgi:hypothetical protein
LISIPKTISENIALLAFGLVAGALFASGCGADGEGTIKAPPGGVESHLGRLSGEPNSPPPATKKPRSAKGNTKVKAIPPDHTNPRS